MMDREPYTQHSFLRLWKLNSNQLNIPYPSATDFDSNASPNFTTYEYTTTSFVHFVASDVERLSHRSPRITGESMESFNHASVLTIMSHPKFLIANFRGKIFFEWIVSCRRGN